MASTIWKGQLTFGLVSFQFRLQKAARRERHRAEVCNGYPSEVAEEADSVKMGEVPGQKKTPQLAGSSRVSSSYEVIRRDTPGSAGYFTEGQRELSPAADLQRGYEVAPDQFVVLVKRRLRASARQPADMQDTALSQDAGD